MFPAYSPCEQAVIQRYQLPPSNVQVQTHCGQMILREDPAVYEYTVGPFVNSALFFPFTKSNNFIYVLIYVWYLMIVPSVSRCVPNRKASHGLRGVIRSGRLFGHHLRLVHRHLLHFRVHRRLSMNAFIWLDCKSKVVRPARYALAGPFGQRICCIALHSL